MPEAFPFHFLRPHWLWALIPGLLLLILILRRQRPEAQWGGVIAPHLLKHLVVMPGTRWQIQPAYLVALALTIGVVALAGPTWRRELPPFVENKSPLMVALALSMSMDARDVAPSRLERGKQKIRDLLAARAGARTGLIAFAGTAHLVMPLTDDASVIEPFLAALTPQLMPVQGKNAVAGVAAAASALASEPVPGTILIVADDLGNADATALRTAAGRNGVLLLRVAASDTGGSSGLDTIAVSADSLDIDALERRIETRYQALQTDTLGTRWRDEGFWLVFPALFIGLIWFRRGTSVQWIILAAMLLQGSPAGAADRSSLRDLLLTPDQKGRLAFDRGDYMAAKQLFADPMWRGIAAYRALDFLAAADAFQHVDTVAGSFALGNAQAQNHQYEKAIKAYDEVLKVQPDNAAAKKNRAIVQAALEAAEKKRVKMEQGEQAPDLPPDATKLDPNQKGGKRTQVTAQDITTAAAAAAWMRAVQTSPAEFLRLKFAIQANEAQPQASGTKP